MKTIEEILQMENEIDRNKLLCERYPFLKPRNLFTDKEIEDYDYSWTYFDEIPKGWKNAFGVLLIEELRDACVEDNILDKIRIDQIKEKYGSLRIYVSNATSKVYRILDKYEKISENVCIHCGKPDVPMINDSWISPYCKECWVKIKKSSTKLNNDEQLSDMYDKLKDSNETISESYTLKFFSDNEIKDKTFDISDTVKKIRDLYNKQIK